MGGLELINSIPVDVRAHGATLGDKHRLQLQAAGTRSPTIRIGNVQQLLREFPGRIQVASWIIRTLVK